MPRLRIVCNALRTDWFGAQDTGGRFAMCASDALGRPLVGTLSVTEFRIIGAFARGKRLTQGNDPSRR